MFPRLTVVMFSLATGWCADSWEMVVWQVWIGRSPPVLRFQRFSPATRRQDESMTSRIETSMLKESRNFNKEFMILLRNETDLEWSQWKAIGITPLSEELVVMAVSRWMSPGSRVVVPSCLSLWSGDVGSPNPPRWSGPRRWILLKRICHFLFTASARPLGSVLISVHCSQIHGVGNTHVDFFQEQCHFLFRST